MHKTLLALCLFAVTFSAPVPAEEIAAIRSECLADISALRERHISTRRHFSDSERRNLKSLGQAARISAASDHDEACRAILEVISDLLESRREELVDEGVVVEVERELRLKELRQAKPIRGSRAVLRADSVIGADLRNLEDEELGEIEDVVVDGASGEIGYLLVSTGGFLGIGEDLVAVPIDRLRATEKLDVLVLEMTPEEIDDAPSISEDNLDRISESGWKEKNALYFESHVGEASQ